MTTLAIIYLVWTAITLLAAMADDEGGVAALAMFVDMALGTALAVTALAA